MKSEKSKCPANASAITNGTPSARATEHQSIRNFESLPTTELRSEEAPFGKLSGCLAGLVAGLYIVDKGCLL
jgi:hypothetical protein